MSNKETYVRSHRRSNKKKPGDHKVRGHYRRSDRVSGGRQKNPHYAPEGPEPDEEMLDELESSVEDMTDEEKLELYYKLEKVISILHDFESLTQVRRSHPDVQSDARIVPESERRASFMQDKTEKYNEAVDKIEDDGIREIIKERKEEKYPAEIASTLNTLRHTDPFVEAFQNR